MKENQPIDLSAYRTLGLPLLQLMGLLATLGIVTTIVLTYLFY